MIYRLLSGNARCLPWIAALAALGGLIQTSAASDFLMDCLAATCGRQECETAWFCSQYEELAARIAPESLAGLPADERLRQLHARLHGEILIGRYRQEASDLRLAISCGDYNCLAAAALYWDLARRAGLELDIWSQPGHVFLGHSELAAGFINPGARDWPMATAEFPREASARRISPAQLVGKFYYNRGVLELAAGKFPAGITALRQSLVLDPADAEAQSNLAAGLNNWAAAQYRQGDFAGAEALLREGLSIAPGSGALLRNQRQVRGALSP
jgi:tetratricopeptide (TPR) repeat protein